MPHHLITTHNTNGQAVLSKHSTSRHVKEVGGGMTSELLYSSHKSPHNLNNEEDISTYINDRENGFPGGAFTAPNGSTSIVSFPPGAETPFHRTMTADIVYVLAGEIEIQLDGGEKKSMEQGDSIVQRGTMHKFKNASRDTVKILCVTLPIVEPFQAGGKTLEMSWGEI